MVLEMCNAEAFVLWLSSGWQDYKAGKWQQRKPGCG
jgi:hypothetical protein